MVIAKCMVGNSVIGNCGRKSVLVVMVTEKCGSL